MGPRSKCMRRPPGEPTVPPSANQQARYIVTSYRPANLARFNLKTFSFQRQLFYTHHLSPLFVLFCVFFADVHLVYGWATSPVRQSNCWNEWLERKRRGGGCVENSSGNTWSNIVPSDLNDWLFYHWILYFINFLIFLTIEWKGFFKIDYHWLSVVYSYANVKAEERGLELIDELE